MYKNRKETLFIHPYSGDFEVLVTAVTFNNCLVLDKQVPILINQP